jgi:DNA polymerase I
MALLIGSLKDLRVNYYKPQAKDKSLPKETQDQYDAITQALKVFLNASYGVMGAEIFPLYFLPSAEAVTAIGRNIISGTVKNCETEGIKVLYGDTDSMFVKKPTKEQIDVVIKKAKEQYSVDLEIDKEYKYVVLSDRKKNYFGIFTDGTVDVKGLTGKKSHTPQFIKNLFEDMKAILKKVETPEEFENAKGEISKTVGECGKNLEAREIPLDQLAFNVMLSKDPDEYTKTTPQHIKVARMIKENREVKKGEVISYIKTNTREGVKPVDEVLPHEIDTRKYLTFMESVLEQILEPMKLNFDRMMGKSVQTPLDKYFE